MNVNIYFVLRFDALKRIMSPMTGLMPRWQECVSWVDRTPFAFPLSAIVIENELKKQANAAAMKDKEKSDEDPADDMAWEEEGPGSLSDIPPGVHIAERKLHVIVDSIKSQFEQAFNQTPWLSPVARKTLIDKV